jgi:hypothetical protein
MRKMNVENDERHQKTDKRTEKTALTGEFERGTARGASNVV